MRKLYIKLYNQIAEAEPDICGRPTADKSVTGKAPKISLIIEQNKFLFILEYDNSITQCLDCSQIFQKRK